MNINPDWSGKSIYGDAYDEIMQYEKDICEHIIIGMSLMYIHCIWTVNATSLLNREWMVNFLKKRI